MLQTSQRSISRLFIACVLILWFLLDLTGLWFDAYRGTRSQPPCLGIAIILPVLLFVIGWFSTARLQHFIASLDVSTLTLIQIGRILGGSFLIVYAAGNLPGIFALPAGWGDVFIGLTAPLLVWWLRTKTRFRLGVFVLWHALGMLDLIVAIGLGILSSQSTLGILSGTTASSTTIIVVTTPLCLIPTFLVPFYFILHLITLDQARKHWAQ